MDFDSLVEGPLLWLAFLAFTAGIFVRIVFFFYVTLRSNTVTQTKSRPAYVLTTLGRWLLPYHKSALKRPVYAGLRYLFHLCLIVVPIWLSPHIEMWSGSRFGWYWTSMSDALADRLTLIVLGFAGFFIIRRLISSDIRRNSSKKDYLLIVLTALPFLTGYLLSHGSLDSISFFAGNMYTIHVLSGEAMLIMVAFLFVRTRLDDERCTACDACALSCPTDALDFNDEDNVRVFRYSHYQCIVCASCVTVCPEDAAELRHDISFWRFFQVGSKAKIRSAQLAFCEKCGVPFMPIVQLEKLRQEISDAYLVLCQRCRQTTEGERVYKLAPWTKKIKRVSTTVRPKQVNTIQISAD